MLIFYELLNVNGLMGHPVQLHNKDELKKKIAAVVCLQIVLEYKF